jgi:hypothetical protein
MVISSILRMDREFISVKWEMEFGSLGYERQRGDWY